MAQPASHPDVDDKLARLRDLLGNNRPVAIAYSGGVDSAFLLAVARETLGDDAIGIIADSPSLPRHALAEALALARRIGARVEVIETHEMQNPDYASNPINRCYYCKAELFGRMESIARARGFAAIAYGENADDAREERPGRTAAHEFAALAPLRHANLGKEEIRILSRRMGLPTADRPSQPCLSSRIPHGTPVTPLALSMIERAEAEVRTLGFTVFRVRHIVDADDSPRARLQIDPAEMTRLPALEPELRTRLAQVGYQTVEIDPDGYRPPRRIPA